MDEQYLPAEKRTDVRQGVREECGVFGAFDVDGNDVAPLVYYGLMALQHRGQEACGIAVSDTAGPRDAIFRKIF